MAAAVAIAQAVGAVGNVISSFIQSAAQKYALTKGNEIAAIDYERRKTLAAYTGTAKTQLAIIILLIVLALIIFRTKK